MGLAESQRLLARLSTDAPLRVRFAADPAAVLAEFGLSAEEAATFAALPLDQLDDFAGSLIAKRRGEVESLLPLTFKAIGPSRFSALFRRHAASFVPVGIKKHRDDAVAFAAFLGRAAIDPPWHAEVARVEAAALLAHDPARRWRFLRLRHHPQELARSATSRETPRSRPTLIVWFRLGRQGRLRRWIVTSQSFRGRP